MYKNRHLYQTLFMILALLLIGGGAWYYYYSHAFMALPYNDAMDYASMARNISLGRGFTSRYLTPLSLAHYGAPYPNLWRGPLWPLFLAGCFKLFGAAEPVVAAAGGFFYLAALPPLFLLGRKIVSQTAAFLGCLLYIFSPLALFYSISGMTEPLALFLLLCWVYLLFQAPGRSPLFYLFTGGVAGLFYLARYNALVFLPLSLLYLWFCRREHEKDRLPKLIIYLGGWLLVVSPWLWRNFQLLGNPFFSLQAYEPAMFTLSYPGYTLYMLPEPVAVWAFILQHPGEILLKISTGLKTFLKNMPDPSFTGTAPLITVLFLAGSLVPRARKTKLFIACCFLAQLTALLVIHYIPRLFFIFLPFYILFALAAVEYLLGFLPRPGWKYLLLTAFTALALLANLPPWHEGNSWHNWPQDYAPAIADAAAQISPQGVVLSNDGHLLSWYADRLALKIPVQWAQVEELEKKAPIEGIWLSNRLRWGNTPEAEEKWLEIMREKPPQLGNYRLFNVYEDGSLFYLRENEGSAIQNPANRDY
ncbi:MAG: glycosyltransferase family 39 protein [Firmicutes bacterium]|nr:glycosyltransferase family 39 protein [Bacillota bacterium]